MGGKKGLKELDLYPTRESLTVSLKRSNSLIETHSASMSVSALEARLSLVESNFIQLCKIQTTIENESDSIAECKVRQDFEDIYCEAKGKILEAIAQNNRRQSTPVQKGSNIQSMNTTHSSPRSTNLPKLTLPTFSGKYTEWTSWYNTFVTLIDSDGDLDDLSKFVLLRSCLGSVPLSAIEGLELSADNYKKAFKLLKDRFENRAIIIQAHVKELIELPKISYASSQPLRQLVDRVNAQLIALKSLGTEKEIFEVVIFQCVRSKLDQETLEKWENHWDCEKLPSWDALSKFVINQHTILANRELNRGVQNKVLKTNNKKGNNSVLVASVEPHENNSCFCCKGKHSFSQCQVFLKLSAIQRYYEAKKYSLCVICLNKRHAAKDCDSDRCRTCNGNHHTLLHRDVKIKKERNIADNSSLQNSKGDSNSSLHSALLPNSSTNFLATAVVLVKGRDSFQKCKCVLDSGSQLNFITDDLVKKLNLDLEPSDSAVIGIGESKTKILGQIATSIKSRLTNFSAIAQFLVLNSITQYTPNVYINIDSWNLPQNIKLADPTFNSPSKVDLLLGVDLFFKLLAVGQIRLSDNLPILQKSLLGWIVVGKCNFSEPLALSSAIAHDNESTEDLNNQVERFWRCEEVLPSKKMLSMEEQLCEHKFLSSIQQTSSGRLIVSLPFKTPHVPLGESYGTAFKRFLNLERKLNKDWSLKEQYSQFIKEYHDLNHLEVVTNPNEIQKIKYFMPHHAILRPDSTTTKLRVVFDASCKSSNGLSLNDILLVGPTLQPDLFQILVRFRFYKFALTADISKMYRQILTDDQSCNYQGILWRDESSRPLQVLRLKTVTYGTSSAPFLAVRCLKFLADSYKELYPVGSEILLKNFYMDDMIAGANTINDLEHLKDEISNLLRRGNFELHKWRSNCQAFLTNNEPLTIKTEDCSKTLGVFWDTHSDAWQFSYNAKNSDPITKRIVLGELSQLFDPLGLLSPVIVLGKIFMQELWVRKIDWDESLPQELNTQWQRFREELKNVSLCSFNRPVVPLTCFDAIQLHGFSDASERAYGAVIYSRVIDSLGNIFVELVTAKSKVASLSATSLPRLELQGALLLAQLMEKVKDCVSHKIQETFYWTDSTIVLNWLSSHSRGWVTFVANRVAKIQELSSTQNWCKIDSKLNPADIVSRGMYPNELNNNQLWQKGPKFLSFLEKDWPQSTWDVVTNNLPEARKLAFSLVVHKGPQYEDIVSQCKFSNDFLKLQRVFSYIFRWVKRIFLRKGDTPCLSEALTVADLRGGLNYIVFNIQNISFSVEIDCLRSNQVVKSAKIQGLNPFIDISTEIPIVRVGGRLAKAQIPFFVKHPILMPNDHVCVAALFNYLHKINSHAGTQALCAFVRQRFWVINSRNLARRTVRRCLACFRQRPVAAGQMMGPLPSYRLKGDIHPFLRAGMDFAGPIMIHFNVRGKRPTKAYLCVFVCFVTKAAHIEVVSELSTNAFIAALKRFFARRGLSSDLFCDNATNFVGASREVKEFAQEIFKTSSKNRISEECTARGVNFHFIPPRAPHFGGIWESAVKVAKNLLVHQINGTSLNFEELTTAVAQVEAIMNSRPLCALSADPNNLEALTPGHFLVGRPLNSLPEPWDDNLLKLTIVNRWKRILWVQQNFWQRWSREYLLSLQQRLKWTKSCQDININALVLISDDNTLPSQWLLGRVVETHPGVDGLTRVVTLRTKSGLLKRSIQKICPLPIED